VGPPHSGKTHLLMLPVQPGRHAAVVVLHPCNGVHVHDEDWAARIAGWGWAAIVPDSFSPRGITSVCDAGRSPITFATRAADAFAAADYLRRRPDIDPDRIGVIGFSHGGSTVLATIGVFAAQRNAVTPFRAAVALYPGCRADAKIKLATDTLLLLGSLDEWTPAERCVAFAAHADRNGHVLETKIYEGAYHLFDVGGTMRHSKAGHILFGTPESVADSPVATRAFLAARLDQ
jgi:dienelactone hydrolase